MPPPESLKHVRPGQLWAPPDATTWNALVDAGRANQLQQYDQTRDGNPVFRQGDIIRVKNVAGLDLLRNSIVGLQEPIFLPTTDKSRATNAFVREVTFRGTIPSSTFQGKFAVLLDPIGIGKIGRAYVAGVCPVKVNIRSAGDTCCDVENDDTTQLYSMSQGGSAQILWAQKQEMDDPTGPQWAYVRLGTNCRICCHSSSSSSTSTSQGCPNDCGNCGTTQAPCEFPALVSRIQEIMPPHVPNGQCMNAQYNMVYQGNCTWHAPTGDTGDESCPPGQLPHYPQNTTAATLFHSGDHWVFFLSDGFHYAEWDGPALGCFVAQDYHPATTLSALSQEPDPGASVFFNTGA